MPSATAWPKPEEGRPGAPARFNRPHRIRQRCLLRYRLTVLVIMA
jgi:hypothetical protein